MPPDHLTETVPRAAAASTISSDCGSGEPFLLVLIIFVVATAGAGGDKPRLVSVEAFASLPRRKRELPGAASAACRGLGRRGVDRRPLQVVAEVEVRGESVPQVLGGESSAVSWSRLV